MIIDYISFFLFHSVGLGTPTEKPPFHPLAHIKNPRDGGNDGSDGSWPGPCHGIPCAVNLSDPWSSSSQIRCDDGLFPLLLSVFWKRGKTRWTRDLPEKAHRGPIGNELSWQCGNRASSAPVNQMGIYSGGWLMCPSFSCGMQCSVHQCISQTPTNVTTAASNLLKFYMATNANTDAWRVIRRSKAHELPSTQLARVAPREILSRVQQHLSIRILGCFSWKSKA